MPSTPCPHELEIRAESRPVRPARPSTRSRSRVELGPGTPASTTWPAATSTSAAYGDALHIVTVASLREGLGVGRALLAAAEAEARRRGAARIAVSTANANLRALALYQRNGYRLAALHANAIARLPALKPAIPAVAANGIPLRDLIDLEKPLR